jgi:hypothetical protein
MLGYIITLTLSALIKAAVSQKGKPHLAEEKRSVE